MKVNNLAEWAKEKKYIVVRDVDGEWWFYDAWVDFEKALKQAREVNGQIIPVSMAE